MSKAKQGIFSAIKYLKVLFVKLSRGDLSRVVRIILLCILGIYIIGGFVVTRFAYSSKSVKTTKGAADLSTSKRDIWVGKFAKIYPLPAATVNGRWVGLGEFYRQVGYIKTFNKQVPQSVSKDITDEKSLRLRVLDNLIDSTLVKQQASKANITVTQKDIDAAYKTASDTNGGDAQINKVLKEMYGMTSIEFKRLIETQLYQDKIREKLLVQVHIEHILVTDQAKADAALARIQKGETFEAVAASASEDSNSKTKGGDLGWLSREDLRDQIGPEFEKAVFTLKKGEISGVVKTQYGYHIIKLLDKKNSIDKTYADWLKEIKQKAKIRKTVKS